MDAFNFAFSLFGLLLGLSLAELFGGFARALRARPKIRIGWMTPLLALLMVIDLISFWLLAWNERGAIPVGFVTLLFGAAIAGIYYMAAALVFPEDFDEWRDLDFYFTRQKAWIIVAVQSSNLLAIAGMLLVHGNLFHSLYDLLRPLLWIGTGGALIIARSRRLNIVLLVFYLQLYWITRLL